MPTQKHFVKEWRSLHLIKQSALAQALGITPQAYSNKENGVTSFKAEEIAVLAPLLKTSVDNLLYHSPAELLS